MRRLVRSGMLLLAISTVPLRADPAGAWRREFRGTDTAVDAGAHAVVLDGAGDVIAAGELTNLGTGPAFTVAKLDGATGGQLWRTEINGPATSFSRATAVTVDAAGDVIA